MKPDDNDPFLNDIEKSKTRLKQEAKDITRLGLTLAALPEKKLHALGLETSVLDAVYELKKMKVANQARKRQSQYLGKLLRNSDYEKIQQTLAQYEIVKESTNRYADEWTEKLLTGDDALLYDFINQHADLDRQQLRQLVRQTKKACAQQKPDCKQNLISYIKQAVSNSQPE